VANLRAKCGWIVVNCLANVDTKDGRFESMAFRYYMIM